MISNRLLNQGKIHKSILCLKMSDQRFPETDTLPFKKRQADFSQFLKVLRTFLVVQIFDPSQSRAGEHVAYFKIEKKNMTF